MKVVATKEVKEYLNNLIAILYEKEYFGFRESAREYIIGLIADIENNLPKLQHKVAPKHFEKDGKGTHYAMFRKNKQTVWYAFFTIHVMKAEKIYLVRYIANNHTIAQYL